jgi:hypothetical protein
MAKRVSIVCIFLILSAKISYSQDFKWAINPQGNLYDVSNDLVTDGHGNSYVGGYFFSTVLNIGLFTLNCTGGFDTLGTPCEDIFVAKFDSSYGVIYAKSFGEADYHERVEGIACDAEGNTYITGWFTSQSFQMDTFVLNNSGSWDFFVAKLDTAGKVLWAKSAAGSSDDVGKAVTVDAQGNVIASGYFWSSTFTIDGVTLNNSGSSDIFLVKFDPDGNLLWAKKAGGGGMDLGNGLDTDPSGNIYLAGQFSSSSINFGGSTLSTSGSSDVFSAKYAPDGTNLWAVKAGGSKMDHCWDIAVWDHNGYVITGAYMSPSISFGGTVLSNAGNNTLDVFVARYDSSGTVLWAKKAGGAGDDIGRSVCFDTAGNVYATGDFYSETISFGTNGTFHNTDSTGTFTDIYIVSFDHSGNVRWMKQPADLYDDKAAGIGCDHYGNTYVSGSFEGMEITFSPITLITTGPADFFITQIGRFTEPPQGIAGTASSSGLQVFPNPAVSSMRITWEESIDIRQISLLNHIGQIVYIADISRTQNFLQMDVHDFAPGLYIVRGAGPGRDYNRKIIINR